MQELVVFSWKDDTEINTKDQRQVCVLACVNNNAVEMVILEVITMTHNIIHSLCRITFK